MDVDSRNYLQILIDKIVTDSIADHNYFWIFKFFKVYRMFGLFFHEQYMHSLGKPQKKVFLVVRPLRPLPPPRLRGHRNFFSFFFLHNF